MANASAEKAVYYNANRVGKVFEVLKKNADGTVDLGLGKTLVVGGCKVVKEPREGHATLGSEPVELKAPEEKPSAAAEATAQGAHAAARI